MRPIDRGVGAITAAAGFVCLAILSSIALTMLALFLVKRTIEVEILLML